MQSGAFSFESKGDASMEYGMIAFLADETDVVEDVLLILSGFFPERRIKGYPVDVADSLRRGLSFFEEAEEGKEGGKDIRLPLSRVYVSMEEEGGTVLIAADSMKERAEWISRKWKNPSGKNFNGSISGSCPKGEWSLVGLAAPGWMLLFDDGVSAAEQDYLNPEVRVAYLPADEKILQFLSPERSTGEVLSLILEYVLSSLPFSREGA